MPTQESTSIVAITLGIITIGAGFCWTIGTRLAETVMDWIYILFNWPVG
jgi:hypothetical protein